MRLTQGHTHKGNTTDGWRDKWNDRNSWTDIQMGDRLMN